MWRHTIVGGEEITAEGGNLSNIKAGILAVNIESHPL